MRWESLKECTPAAPLVSAVVLCLPPPSRQPKRWHRLSEPAFESLSPMQATCRTRGPKGFVASFGCLELMARLGQTRLRRSCSRTAASASSSPSSRESAERRLWRVAFQTKPFWSMPHKASPPLGEKSAAKTVSLSPLPLVQQCLLVKRSSSRQVFGFASTEGYERAACLAAGRL